MLRLVAIFCGILFSAALAFGQGTIQVGYAVVTPSFPITTGMTVFENLIQAGPDVTLETSLVPSNLLTNALLPVDVSSSLSKNLGIAIANPNAALASVTLTLRKADGTDFSTTTLTVNSRRQTSKLVTELFPPPAPGTFTTQVPIPAEFTGTMAVASTVPISFLGLKFRGSAYSMVTLIDSSTTINPVPVISSGVGGLGAVILPQFVTGGGWATEVGILNTTNGSLTVRLDVFTPDGNPLLVKLNDTTASSFTNLVVAANGSLTVR